MWSEYHSSLSDGVDVYQVHFGSCHVLMLTVTAKTTSGHFIRGCTQVDLFLLLGERYVLLIYYPWFL